MLPATVIGGWLGAGKTTLVNRMLRAAGGQRLAVLVNDFGAIGIDADLIESRDGDVMNLAGGCACCAVGSDLVAGLLALPARLPAFDRVIVETSGVALPGSIARAVKLVQGIELDGVVVLVDAETVRDRADDRHVGDLVRRQLAEADLLVLNKVDLVDAPTLASLRGWLARIAPRAPRVATTDADVPAEVLLGIDASQHTGSGGGLRASTHAVRPAADVLESVSLALDGRYDAAVLREALADPALLLMRAKGLLVDVHGASVLVQAVGTRVRVGPVPAGTAASRAGATGRMVLIGTRGTLDVDRITQRIALARRD